MEGMPNLKSLPSLKHSGHSNKRPLNMDAQGMRWFWPSPEHLACTVPHDTLQPSVILLCIPEVMTLSLYVASSASAVLLHL